MAKRRRPPGLVRAKRVTMECCSVLCGWRAERAAGCVQPCPTCGGPVLVAPWDGRRSKGPGRTLEVRGLEPRDVEALAEIGGGNPGTGAEQVIRGFLAGRRLMGMLASAEKS